VISFTLNRSFGVLAPRAVLVVMALGVGERANAER
jgi:hypothetical protein